MRPWVLVIAAACSSSPPAARPVARPTAQPRATASWQELARVLPGTWTGTTDDGTTVDVAFRAISRGSALAETFGAAGRETMTLYHPDHGDIVATHYCGQGNAARLRVVRADGGHVVLRQVDVTDLDPEEASLVEMELVLAATGDAFERVEVYRDANGAVQRTRWRFVRR